MRELTLEATVGNIETVTNFVDEELETLECSPRAMTQINVAIDELFGNIAQYAYHPATGNVTIQIDAEQETSAVTITFIDHGKPFNPLANPDPDITTDAEERSIGGLGIFMVKKTMDAMEYKYYDEKNILKIKKNIQS